MNTVRDIESLRDYPSTASKEFRDQIGAGTRFARADSR
jgi:hypothetical protein